METMSKLNYRGKTMANELENVLSFFLSEGFLKLKEVKRRVASTSRSTPQGSINHSCRKDQARSLGLHLQMGHLHTSPPSSLEAMTSRWNHILTGAAEALLAHPDQHVQAEVAVGRFVKVLESPHMLSIIFHVLPGT